MNNSSVRSVRVQNNAYTIQEIHANNNDCSVTLLYSLSPGLYGRDGSNQQDRWSLLQIDPSSGMVVSATLLVQDGFWRNEYGGVVYGVGVAEGDLIYHVFSRLMDGALYLAAVNVTSKMIEFGSYLDVGAVVDVLNLNSLVYL